MNRLGRAALGGMGAVLWSCGMGLLIKGAVRLGVATLGKQYGAGAAAVIFIGAVVTSILYVSWRINEPRN